MQNIEHSRSNVKDPRTGAEWTTTKAHADNSDLKVVDKDAVDKFGRHLPAKNAPLHSQGQGKTAEDASTKTAAAAAKNDAKGA